MDTTKGIAVIVDRLKRLIDDEQILERLVQQPLGDRVHLRTISNAMDNCSWHKFSPWRNMTPMNSGQEASSHARQLYEKQDFF